MLTSLLAALFVGRLTELSIDPIVGPKSAEYCGFEGAIILVADCFPSVEKAQGESSYSRRLPVCGQSTHGFVHYPWLSRSVLALDLSQR